MRIDPGEASRHNVIMAARLLPLFPLTLVVFPKTRLPLHIFEERYKHMVGEAIRDQSEFGIVQAKDEGIVNTGCTVRVEKVMHRYPDGRMDVLTMGARRFEIHSLNEELDYLQGEVTFFDDEDERPAPAELRDLAVANYHSLNQLASAREHGQPDFESPQLSFQVAQAVPDLDFLNTLLQQRSEIDRLREFNQYVGAYVPKQRSRERMRELAPKNGFGPKPAGM
jgi:Lon protease-like protein